MVHSLCPDIWSHRILGVSVRVFLEELAACVKPIGHPAHPSLPPTVGSFFQSAEGPHGTKRLTLPRILSA